MQNRGVAIPTIPSPASSDFHTVDLCKMIVHHWFVPDAECRMRIAGSEIAIFVTSDPAARAIRTVDFYGWILNCRFGSSLRDHLGSLIFVAFSLRCSISS